MAVRDLREVVAVATINPTPTPHPQATAIVPPTDTPTVQAAAPVALADCAPDESTPSMRHDVVASVNYNARTIAAQQTITYINRTGEPLPDLVLNVEPNRWLDAFALASLDLNGTPANYDLTGRRLTVALSSPLNPGCSVELALTFAISVPPIIGGVEAFRGYFGETPRQINLGHWLPTIVPRVGDEWALRDSIFVGEQIVLAPADWHITINVQNAPEGIVVAAPGIEEQVSESTWRFVHIGGREFAASISPVFRVATDTTPDGIIVQTYSMPDALVPDGAGGFRDGGAYANRVAAESLQRFVELYGPYPHERMVVVQGDFPDGMEFSGFAIVSTDWFVSYEGSPQSYLMLITVHEVAHQWWYDLVGNDQARSPWLDEALSTYSEYVYIEAAYPNLRDWWWFFRVNRLNPEGSVDSTVYEFDAIRPYINAVYLRGVLLLDAIREDIGDEAFFAWLRRYAEAEAGQLADASALWAAMTQAEYDATTFTRAAFLRRPGLE